MELRSFSGKTVLITGAAGMLGGSFREILSRIPDCTLIARSRAQLDVTDRQRVMDLAARRPQVIIHCAANVDAENCEREPERCRLIQVEGTRNIADLAEAVGARVMYPQSFLIFDGRQLPITEDTEPAPKSVYARCKLEAENLVRERVPDALVVRMAGFFGGDGADKNFVGKFTGHLPRLLEAGQRSYAVGDRVWQPTYTLDLAANSLLLLDRGAVGVYNMASSDEASFFEVARACVEELGLDHRITIEEVTAAEVSREERAFRPERAVMENRRLRQEGLDRQRPWREALGEYLRRPYFRDLFAAFVSG